MNISRRQLMASAALLSTLAPLKQAAFAKALADTGLKDAYRDDFLIGTAISSATLAENDTKTLNLIAREFNAVTAENAMKWAPIRPTLDNWQWDLADKFVEFGTNNKMHIVGHTLVWHSQVPPDIFLDKKGKPLNKTALFKVMDEHVTTMMERYKDRIPTWDVVNEAIEDDGQWRNSPWYQATGTDYIARAFNLAHELDPKAHLTYNDYNMAMPGKRETVVAMLKDFKKRGVPIHGVGLQGHVSTGHPDLAEFEKSIVAFAEQGVRVHITELDVDVLPTVWGITGADIATRFQYRPELDPFITGLTPEGEKALSERYVALFKIFLKHRDKIDRVTLWGVSDKQTWLNDFPIPGRTNYPLLFDRELQPKDAYFRLLDLKR